MNKRSMVLILALFLWFAAALRALDARQQALGKQQLTDAIHRSAAACYAAEGVYPPSVEYLEARYGLQYNKERYIVRYEIFASNLMPEITVLEVTP